MEMFPDVVDRVNLGGVCKNARDRGVDQCIVFPTVPQARDDIQELPGALVAFAVRRVFGEAEILRRLRYAGRDNVPASASAADVIERGEKARGVVGAGM